jgi:hypothetical protein
MQGKQGVLSVWGGCGGRGGVTALVIYRAVPRPNCKRALVAIDTHWAYAARTHRPASLRLHLHWLNRSQQQQRQRQAAKMMSDARNRQGKKWLLHGAGGRAGYGLSGSGRRLHFAEKSAS